MVSGGVILQEINADRKRRRAWRRLSMEARREYLEAMIDRERLRARDKSAGEAAAVKKGDVRDA